MKFSLIMATYSRLHEIRFLLESLTRQTYKNFELIVVDQNPLGYLDEILNEYEGKITIKHLFSEKGLSKARNIGLNAADGDYIAYPDDDCIYPNDLLEKVHNFFQLNQQINIYSCVSVDPITNKFSNNKWRGESGRIRRSNIFSTAISYSVFIKTTKETKSLLFNPRLGVGAEYGSGEETDYLLNLIDIGYKAYYNNKLFVFHSDKKTLYDQAACLRNYNYALGMGAVFKIHLIKKRRYQLLKPFIKSFIIAPLLKVFISFLKFKREELAFHKSTLIGRWRGLVLYK